MAKEVVVTREGYDKLVHDLDELRQEYNAQFGAVIPATKVLRLYQIEGLREAVIRVDRFKKVPLAK